LGGSSDLDGGFFIGSGQLVSSLDLDSWFFVDRDIQVFQDSGGSYKFFIGFGYVLRFQRRLT